MTRSCTWNSGSAFPSSLGSREERTPAQNASLSLLCPSAGVHGGAKPAAASADLVLATAAMVAADGTAVLVSEEAEEAAAGISSALAEVASAKGHAAEVAATVSAADGTGAVVAAADGTGAVVS